MNETNPSQELIQPIRDDVLSGAAEIALRAISLFQGILASSVANDASRLASLLSDVAWALVDAQPAMAPLFHLCNKVLLVTERCQSQSILAAECQKILDDYERQLCESVNKIADYAFDLIPPGELVFAYSFSSTVVSCLLNSRARGRYFRVACSESRPGNEGKKLATRLAAGNIEVIYTFDSAMGLVLPNCSIAFMGCDCVGKPGLVNKAGSLLLALACRDMSIPLYGLCGTEKFVGEDERMFAFENHDDRPGDEIWKDPPKGVRVLNRQFELIPLSYFSGLVTERGIIKESQLSQYLPQTPVHKTLELAAATF